MENQLPPYRTWIVTTNDWEPEGDDLRLVKRTIEAHTIEVSDSGIVNFETFFIQPETGQRFVCSRYFLAAGTWREIEEINPAFMESVKN